MLFIYSGGPSKKVQCLKKDLFSINLIVRLQPCPSLTFFLLCVDTLVLDYSLEEKRAHTFQRLLIKQAISHCLSGVCLGLRLLLRMWLL